MTTNYRFPREMERAKAAVYAVVDAAAAVYTAATGCAVDRPLAEADPPVDPAALTVTADYASALDHLDRCVHSAPPEYVAEAAQRFVDAVTDATPAPDFAAALTGLRAALDDYDAAEAEVAALVERNRAKHRPGR